MPKVSVIIPVYNVEKYLHECLDSLLNQTLKDIEIIAVDDGSTDSSLKILKDYAKKDKRLKVLTQENKGAGAARNLGMKHATGSYLSILDSDDYFDHSMLELLYKKAEKTKAKDVVLQAIRNAMVNMPLQQMQSPQFTEMANSSSNIAMSQAMQSADKNIVSRQDLIPWQWSATTASII